MQLDAQHFRHTHDVGAAAHGDSDIQSTGTDGQHPHAAAGRRVTIGAEQRLAGRREALQVHLMTDAIAGT